jgi:large subunit ribosomal protein L15
MPDHFGRSGFKRHASLIKKPSTLNAGDLDSQADAWVSSGKARKTKDTVSIDLTSLGFDKLLGKGVVKRKYEITVGACSKKAREKIEASGGKLNVAENPKEETEETKPE